MCERESAWCAVLPDWRVVVVRSGAGAETAPSTDDSGGIIPVSVVDNTTVYN